MKSFFESRPTPLRHPRFWYCSSIEFGLLLPSLTEPFRMLDIGCSTGRSLLPLASQFPQSEFVGVDLSSEAIAVATECSNALALKNCRFLATDGASLSADQVGEFQYIVCHGLLSWVDRVSCRALLTTISELLSRTNEGAACMVSLHMLPGAQIKVSLRHWLESEGHLGLAQSEAGLEKALQALRERMSDLLLRSDEPSLLLAAEIGNLLKRDPIAIAHDYFAPTFTAFQPEEFVKLCKESGLEVVAELDGGARRFSTECVARDNRSLVHLLLMKESPKRELLSKGERVAYQERFFYSCSLVPRSDPPDVISEASETFLCPAGKQHTFQSPFEKAALITMRGVWPKHLAFRELLELAQALSESTHSDEELSSALHNLLGYLRNAQVLLESDVELFLARGVETAPSTFPWVQLEAVRSNWVTTATYEFFPLSAFDEKLLPLLDGKRDKANLLQHLSAMVLSGMLGLRVGGEKPQNSEQIADILQETLEETLLRYSEHSLLALPSP